MSDLIFEDWGLIDYEEALKRQFEHLETVSQDESHPGFLIFCSHPHVVTTGRQTKPEDIFAWKGPIIEISRGGRATYHGPSQLVVYPIIKLKKPRAGRGPQEIRGYLRALEEAIINTLRTFGVEAFGKTNDEDTGVWVGGKKIASLGIAVKKWISFHGAAINLDYDPEAFIGLNPCGFSSNIMTNLETLTGRKIDRILFSATLRKNCQQLI